MKAKDNIKAIFFDVGGVCLSNGWDESSRKKLAKKFNLDFGQTESVHANIFEEFECGDVTLEEYINMVYSLSIQKGKILRKEIISFMKKQSRSFPTTLEILEKLKQNGDYRLATINNESFSLNQFRIEKFNLKRYFSNFFSSSFLHMRKPEPRIFKVVIHITRLEPNECLYIDDRTENIEAALKEGINGIHLQKVKELGESLKKYNIKF